MRCPFCRHSDSRVVDSREVDEGQVIRRRRSCAECGRRFTTVEEAVLAVVKRSGVTEPFSRDKVVSGVRRACQGRPVDEDAEHLGETLKLPKQHEHLRSYLESNLTPVSNPRVLA